LQCWKDGELLGQEVETPNTPLADPDTLNAQIPKEEWEEDLNGQPRPPWALYFVTYLWSPDDASEFTAVNSTKGMLIAWERLHDRIDRMRWMRGADVVPLIALDTSLMKTKYGEKQRPEFTIIDWREFGGGQTALPPTPTPALPNNSGPAAKESTPRPGSAKKKPTKKVPGKPVTQPTVEEELNDEIPTTWGAG
jgi:hypothetical protein